MAVGVALILLRPGFAVHGAPFLLTPWRAEAVSPFAITVEPGDLELPRGAALQVIARLEHFDAEGVTHGGPLSWLEEHRGFARHRSAVVVICAIGSLSLVSVLAYNVWADVTVGRLGLNDVFDYVPNQILLPVGGFLIALFAGWFVSRSAAETELAIGDPRVFQLWYVLIRYVVPPTVLVIFLVGVTG